MAKTLNSSSPKRRRGSGNAATQLLRGSAELGLAVPQVVGHRVARMAMAGPVLSPRDRREFQGMVAEKGQAFVNSWQAMALQAAKAQQAMVTSLFSAWWQAALRGGLPTRAVAAGLAHQQGQAGLKILNAGLKPVRSKAVANAKRLRRTPLKVTSR